MDKEDNLQVLRKLRNKPESSQRELAKELNFSLGKLNYCLKSLQQKGLIKIKNFKKNPKKINYLYILTPKGISEKTKLTLKMAIPLTTQLKSVLQLLYLYICGEMQLTSMI